MEVGGVVDQVPHALQELHLFPLEFQEEVPGGGDEEHLFFLHDDASLHTVTLVWLSRAVYAISTGKRRRVGKNSQ